MARLVFGMNQSLEGYVGPNATLVGDDLEAVRLVHVPA